MPFIVDPASERTFIVPFWEGKFKEHLKKKRKPLAFTNDAKPAISMWTALRFKTVHGIELLAPTIDGHYRQLTRKPDVSFVREMFNRFRARNQKVNILGNDVLKRWNLYHNPHTEIKLLTNEDLDECLAKDEKVRAVFRTTHVKPNIRYEKKDS